MQSDDSFTCDKCGVEFITMTPGQTQCNGCFDPSDDDMGQCPICGDGMAVRDGDLAYPEYYCMECDDDGR